MQLETLEAMIGPLTGEAREAALFDAAVAAVAGMSQAQVNGTLAALQGHPALGEFQNIAWAAGRFTIA